jgi:His-Xaa-Ser system protein HxsD
MNPRMEVAKSVVTCEVDEKVFSRQVVVSAAYLFLERCYIRLERAGKNSMRVRLKGKKKLSKPKLQALADEFDNELLHQLVRDQVARRTDSLREVIVGRALLSAEPMEGPDDSGRDSGQEPDYLDDPLGIAVPWEEKYGDEEE